MWDCLTNCHSGDARGRWFRVDVPLLDISMVTVPCVV